MGASEPVELEADLASRFVRDGYVVVDDLVGADDRQRIVDDAHGFADGTYPVRNPPDDGQILSVHFPHWVSPVAADMVSHPGVAQVVGTIAGAHLPDWDGRTKCMQSMLFFKPPGLQGQAWHQDERYIPTRDRSLVGAWVALDDATVDNGCLWVLPGSHRNGMLHPTRDHGRPDEFDQSDEAYGFDDGDAIPVEVSAGAVVFFNGYLLHRSLRNRSDRTRMALVNHYMNAWSLLPWQLDAGVDVGTADTRLITPVTGADPYPHKPIDPPPQMTWVRPRTAPAAEADDLSADEQSGEQPASSEAKRIDTGVTIAAPPSAVWAVLSDVARYCEWNPYVVEAVGSGEAGSSLTITTAPTGADRRFTFDVDVVSASPPSRLEWEGGGNDRDAFRTRHVWTLTAHADGTDVHHFEVFEGPDGHRMYDLVRRGLRHDFDRFNAALRQTVEARLAAER